MKLVTFLLFGLISLSEASNLRILPEKKEMNGAESLVGYRRKLDFLPKKVSRGAGMVADSNRRLAMTSSTSEGVVSSTGIIDKAVDRVDDRRLEGVDSSTIVGLRRLEDFGKRKAVGQLEKRRLEKAK